MTQTSTAQQTVQDPSLVDTHAAEASGSGVMAVLIARSLLTPPAVMAGAALRRGKFVHQLAPGPVVTATIAARAAGHQVTTRKPSH